MMLSAEGNKTDGPITETGELKSCCSCRVDIVAVSG